MTDALTIGGTQAQAATARTTYRRLLGFNLIVQVLVGLIAIVVPMWLARRANLPRPTSAGWMRLWGAMLLITASLYRRASSYPPTYVRRTVSVWSGRFSWRGLLRSPPRGFV